MRFTAFALAATLGAAALPAGAAPVTLAFNAGPVTAFTNGTGLFPEFQIGEEILFEFTIDSTIADSNGAPSTGRFTDPNGTITLTGLTSGETLSQTNGAFNQTELVINGLAQITLNGGGNEFSSIVLTDGVDLESATPIVSNPDDLAQSLIEIQAALTNGLFTGFTGISGGVSEMRTSFFNFPIQTSSIVFGPVNQATTPIGMAPIPLPAGGVLLLTGLGAVAALRRRRRAA